MFPMGIAKFSRIALLYHISGGCFWKSYHGTVKSAGVPVLWFHASMSFRFWANNSLQSHDKKILPCLNWLVMCIQFQRVFWKNNCFWFWWRTYTRHCTRNYVISCVKRLSSPVLCSWSGAFNFRVRLETQDVV